MKITIELDGLIDLKKLINIALLLSQDKKIIESNLHESIQSEPIKSLYSNIKLINCLKLENINTIGELLEYRSIDLLRIPNLGKTTLAEIEEVLAEHGLFLKGP